MHVDSNDTVVAGSDGETQQYSFQHIYLYKIAFYFSEYFKRMENIHLTSHPATFTPPGKGNEYTLSFLMPALSSPTRSCMFPKLKSSLYLHVLVTDELLG